MEADTRILPRTMQERELPVAFRNDGTVSRGVICHPDVTGTSFFSEGHSLLAIQLLTGRNAVTPGPESQTWDTAKTTLPCTG
jgi:hypothetical protein